MNNRTQKGIIFIVMLMLILSGCGIGNTGNSEAESVSAPQETPENTASEEKNAIEEYELKYASGEFGTEDYYALAELYGQEGMIKKQRDMLEQCYRLYGDVRCLDALKEITVNIEEENNRIKEEAERMLMNISTPEYLDEAVGMLISDDWQNVMMPKLHEGSRRYYLADEDGGVVLCFEAGYDETGKEYSTVWHIADNGKMQCIMKKADNIQMLTTEAEDGTYQGAFESWLCMGDSGDVYHETGTFERGVCVGDYTARVKYGKEASDLFSLWKNRKDMDMTEYTGFFAEGGVTTVTQSAEGQKKVIGGGIGGENAIIYAYTMDKSGYLFMDVEEGTDIDSFVFDYSVIGADTYPEIALYEAQLESGAEDKQEQMINSADVKVRVYDSNVEWFDGNKWHVLGEVAEYVQADPFAEYEEKQIQEQTEEEGAEESSRFDVYKRRGGGIIEKKAPANTSSKPSKQPKSETPANPAAPVVPEIPTQNTPPVSNGGAGSSESGSNGSGSGGGGNSSGGGGSNDSGNGSGGGSNSGGSGDSGGGNNSGGGSDNGGSNNGGDSGGGSGSSGDSSGDVDIEWTDDIL